MDLSSCRINKKIKNHSKRGVPMNQQVGFRTRVALGLTSFMIAALVSACSPAVSAPTPVPAPTLTVALATPTSVPPSPTPAAAKPAAPAAGVADVPIAYMAAANSGSLDAALAFYADNAVVRNPLGLFIGKQQIGDWLKVDVQTTRANPGGYQVSGNTVVVTGTVSLDRFMKMGVDPVAFRSDYVIEDGKIKFFSPTTLLTPEQQEKVMKASPPPPAPAAGLTDVPKAYIAAANSGNLDTALAFYADNAVVRNPLGLFIGKQQIGDWLKIDVQTTRSNPGGYQVNGNAVVVTGTVSLDRFMKMGVDPVAFRSDYIIEDGKIKFFSPTVLLTPEQQAKIAAAAAKTP
jgi:ketosteroid isomerase-like protein